MRPKGKSKLLIIIIAVVVLLVGGGAAAFFLMGSDEPAQAEQTDQAQVQTAAEPIAYVNIAQPFIFKRDGRPSRQTGTNQSAIDGAWQ